MNLGDFPAVCDEGWRRVNGTPGYLAEREARFLMLAAAGAPAAGAIVEIGTFKGRSTVGLAYVAQRYGLGSVVAIDPHTSPSTTDPDLGTDQSSYDEFQENLRRAGVAEVVDCRRAFSHEVARDWTQLLQVDRLGAVPAGGRRRLAIPRASAASRRGGAPAHSGGTGGLGPDGAGALAPQALVEPVAASCGRSRPVGHAGGDQVAAPEPAPYCGRRGTPGGPMPEQLVGTVVHYFKGPSVAVVRVAEGALAVGDRIRFHGHTTDFTEQITSMEVNHQKVPLAKAGDEVAIQVADRTRQHDQVFKVTP